MRKGYSYFIAIVTECRTGLKGNTRRKYREEDTNK
jgi:hypothetical protein